MEPGQRANPVSQPRTSKMEMRMMRGERSSITKAFTLIELLIVVAIIAVLAVIALPNFLEAQTRAKIAAVTEDMRTIAIAAEAYYTDHNAYPPHRFPNQTHMPYYLRYKFFTTPIAYLTHMPIREPFEPAFAAETGPNWEVAPTHYLTWTNFYSYHDQHPLYPYRLTHAYLIRSRGPDTRLEPDPVRNAHFQGEGHLAPDPFVYDPTNGTVSRGEIFRTRVEWN